MLKKVFNKTVKIKYKHLLKKKTPGSSGYDLTAYIDKPITIRPFETISIPTSVYLEMPEGIEAQVRSRSGLALASGVIVLNSPGTIDSDYRGEIGVILINLSSKNFTITPRQRIAQLVFASYLTPNLKRIETVNTNTKRGIKGFGSTGEM